MTKIEQLVERFPIGLQAALRSSLDNVALWKYAGEESLRNGDMALAEEAVRVALKMSPSDPDLQSGLASIFVQTRRFSAAAAILETLQSRDNLSPKSTYMLARALYHDGKLEAAQREFKKARDQWPDFTNEEVESLRHLLWPSCETKQAAANTSTQRNAICFADVGGMEPIKEEIRMKVVYPT